MSTHDEKRSEVVSFKITPSLKSEFDNLPDVLKKKLVIKVLKDIDFAVYISKYRPPESI